MSQCCNYHSTRQRRGELEASNGRCNRGLWHILSPRYVFFSFFFITNEYIIYRCCVRLSPPLQPPHTHLTQMMSTKRTQTTVYIIWVSLYTTTSTRNDEWARDMWSMYFFLSFLFYLSLLLFTGCSAGLNDMHTTNSHYSNSNHSCNRSNSRSPRCMFFYILLFSYH